MSRFEGGFLEWPLLERATATPPFSELDPGSSVFMEILTCDFDNGLAPTGASEFYFGHGTCTAPAGELLWAATQNCSAKCRNAVSTDQSKNI